MRWSASSATRLGRTRCSAGAIVGGLRRRPCPRPSSGCSPTSSRFKPTLYNVWMSAAHLTLACHARRRLDLRRRPPCRDGRPRLRVAQHGASDGTVRGRPRRIPWAPKHVARGHERHRGVAPRRGSARDRAGRRGDLPDLTFVATAAAMLQAGATVRFGDSTSLDDFSLDPAEIDRLVTARTRAVVVMHYGGFPVDMDAIRAAAEAQPARDRRRSARSGLGAARRAVRTVGRCRVLQLLPEQEHDDGRGRNRSSSATTTLRPQRVVSARTR